MKDIKDKIDNIQKEIDFLENEKYNLLLKASKDFNDKMNALQFPLYIKYKVKETLTLFAILDSPKDMESQVWKVTKGASCFIPIHHFVIVKKYPGAHFLNREFFGGSDVLFNFFNTVEFISKDDFKRVVQQWFDDSEILYKNEEEGEPDPNWFVNLGYDKFFENYKDFLPNNETI